MRRLLIVTVVAAAAALPAGCGGGHGAATHAAAAAAAPPDATVQLADCDLWHELRPAGRTRLLAGMRGVFGGAVDGGQGRGQVLTDAAAEQLLDRACKPSWAGRFKLYKLYGRAAAFTPTG